MTGALALGSSPAGLASLQELGPQRAVLGKGTQAAGLRMGPVGGLWLSRGDSDTGTLRGWGFHSEKPPTLCLGISAPQSQPCQAVLLSFCIPLQGLCTCHSLPLEAPTQCCPAPALASLRSLPKGPFSL